LKSEVRELAERSAAEARNVFRTLTFYDTECGMTRKKTLEEHKVRFWSMAAVGAPESCWPWKHHIMWCGYGLFWDGTKTRRANRVAWEYTNGPIPPGLLVCHRCDNAACVNPAHLFLGDTSTNMSDKVAKGRHTKGADVNTAKLTERKVREIRAKYDAGGHTTTSLAPRYGVRQTTIWMIVKRKTWKHVV
jgi:hypothetical protein